MMEAGLGGAAINRMRLALFLLVAALHGFLIFFLVFHLETTGETREPDAKKKRRKNKEEGRFGVGKGRRKR